MFGLVHQSTDTPARLYDEEPCAPSCFSASSWVCGMRWKRITSRLWQASPRGAATQGRSCCRERRGALVTSGGVFQNDLLLADVAASLGATRIQLWTNREVPPNDGGISLGQAALSLDSAAR